MGLEPFPVPKVAERFAKDVKVLDGANLLKPFILVYVPDPVFRDGEILTNSKLKVPVYIQLRAGEWERWGVD